MNDKVVCFGELMMRLSTSNFQKIQQSQSFAVNYGGAEANVAVSLAQFGENVAFATRLPQNELGDTAIMQLKSNNVDTSFITRGGKRLGMYLLEVGTMHRGTKVIYDRDDSGFATLAPGMINWKEVFKNATWFHWSGISPAVSEASAEVTLEAVKAAKEAGVMVSCDLNYRGKLWKYGKTPIDVMPQLMEYTDMVLGGKSDAALMLGVKFQEGDSFDSAPKRIKEQYPHLKLVATSLRESFSASHNRLTGVLFNGENEYRSVAFDMPNMVDRVGGGDAFMAGLIYGFLNFDLDYQQTIEFAAAASCIKHTIPGDANLSSVEEVKSIMTGADAGLVAR
ncbi:sugar kinase [Flammeovirga kamogawensis]|uniref:Sugar kinase n=2 Tax=Flammeovirga kamogawensis TaxID=373891 RepID=A0ABX8H4T1_9BACT|nr:sugar kinase [Flammeovirga kamogawensis]TRX63963.1 sugar kinase [Flammeovirga kamogawensis]